MPGASPRNRALLVALATTTVGASFVLTGCSNVKVGKLPLRETFADCSRFTGNDKAATVDCPRGELRILVSRPELAPIHLVPFRFEKPVASLQVEADVRGNIGGVYGLGCGTTKTNEAGRGYAFMIVPEVGTTIVRLDVSDDGRRQVVRTLNSAEAAPAGGRSHRVHAVCTKVPGGPAELTMLVDGKVTVKARDDAPLGQFRAALAAVIAAAPGSRAQFDNLTASAGHRR